MVTRETGKESFLCRVLGNEQPPAHLARGIIEEKLRSAILDGRLPSGTALRQQELATLFGVIMLAHQIGGFMGAWVGGKVFEATGSYNGMWYADILLAIGAVLVNLPIREEKLIRVAA